MRTTNQTIFGLILAGGQGTRMGGQDKGLVVWQGKPLIQHTFSVLAPQVSQIIISANRNLSEYAQFGVPVVSDENLVFNGPVAGISSAIKHLTDTPSAEKPIAILVTPCDTPNIPSDLVARLLADQEHKQSDVCVAFDGERQQNLHCLIRDEAWDDLLEFYAQGNLALKDWFKRVNTSRTDFSDKADSFNNLNRLEDLDHKT